MKKAADFSFEGRVVLITGAGRGIGRAHALPLAALGARIVVNDLGCDVVPGSAASAGPASAVVDEIIAMDGEAVASFADISRPEGAKEAVDLALATYGRIDCVINNAGTSVHKPFEEVLPDELEAMLRLHIGGHFYVTQAAWPHFVRQSYGRVVMTSSGSGLFGSMDNHHYAAAKGGVTGLTRSLAINAVGCGIRVNAVAPMAATRLAANIADEKVREAFSASIRPEQVSPVVAWLAHEKCSLNGEIIEVGGGYAGRILIAEGAGCFDPDMDVAGVDRELPAIMSEIGYALPRAGEETVARLLARLGVKLG